MCKNRYIFADNVQIIKLYRIKIVIVITSKSIMDTLGLYFSIFRSIHVLENRKNHSRTIMVEENVTLMQEVSHLDLIPEKHFLIY